LFKLVKKANREYLLFSLGAGLFEAMEITITLINVLVGGHITGKE